MPATTSKKCGRCCQVYRGFGSTCATCRKTPGDGFASAAVDIPTDASPAQDSCGVCGQRVYAVEHMSVEGVTFHKDCFRCTTCRRKLHTHFEKSGEGFFCLAHFTQITKVTGGYMLGAGPSRGATTTNLLKELVGSGGPDGEVSIDFPKDVEPDLDKKVEVAETSDFDGTAWVADLSLMLSKEVLDELKGMTQESDAIELNGMTEGFSKYYLRHFLPAPVVQWTPSQTVA